MLIQEERYKKHILNLKNVKPVVDSNVVKCNSMRNRNMNSTMNSNRQSMRARKLENANFIDKRSQLEKYKTKKRRHIITSNSPRYVFVELCIGSDTLTKSC